MPVITRENGSATWTHQDGDKYLATGVDRNGRRFRKESDQWFYIRCINLWRGTKWLVRNGRRHRICAVYN